MTVLSNEERIRYGRHLLLPEISAEGQARLRSSSVLVIGAGGLGSPIALYLAAAGVGRLGLLDDDDVALSNLQRQILFGTADVGFPKAARGALRLRDLNPGVLVEPMQVRFSSGNAVPILSEFDIVVDASDNFETRYLLADASSVTGRPVVYGAVYRFEGQVSVFGLPGSSCYRCLFPVPPPAALSPSCGESGVLGAATGVIGSLQAVETLKLLAGIGDPLAGRLLVVDLLKGSFESMEIPPDPSCPACGISGPRPPADDYEAFCGWEGMQQVPHVSAAELHGMMGSSDPPFLVDVRRPHESLLASIGGVVIPESELEARITELESFRTRTIVCYCRAGIRSARAVRVLQRVGFERVVHLDGGLGAWAEKVDPDLPLY